MEDVQPIERIESDFSSSSSSSGTIEPINLDDIAQVLFTYQENFYFLWKDHEKMKRRVDLLERIIADQWNEYKGKKRSDNFLRSQSAPPEF